MMTVVATATVTLKETVGGDGGDGGVDTTLAVMAPAMAVLVAGILEV